MGNLVWLEKEICCEMNTMNLKEIPASNSAWRRNFTESLPGDVGHVDGK